MRLAVPHSRRQYRTLRSKRVSTTSISLVPYSLRQYRTLVTRAWQIRAAGTSEGHARRSAVCRKFARDLVVGLEMMLR
eukprot:1793740-Rhodomonas_salina.1